MYEFSFKEIDAYRKMEFIHTIKDEAFTFQEHGFNRYDWHHPCAFCYKRDYLLRKGLKYPIAKSGEDGPFVEMALYFADTFSKINRIMLNYWENENSCVHTTSKISNLSESYKALQQEEAFFRAKHIGFDAEDHFAWSCIANLPKLCAQHTFSDVQAFMKECEQILERRPDIRYGDATWSEIEVWRNNPHAYWLKNHIKYGIPLKLKAFAYSIPGLKQVTNYIYNRYHRKFKPIKQ